jgi:hypothetical protein
MYYEYHWLHISSGTTNVRRLDREDVHSELQLLRLLNEWNLAGRGKWQYWIDPNSYIK